MRKAFFLIPLLFLSACASTNQTPPQPEPVSVKKPIDYHAIESLAHQHGFKSIKNGDSLTIIIPVEGHFHPKRTLLLPSSLMPLSHLAKEIKKKPDLRVSIVGKTDQMGTIGILRSGERADSVVGVLRFAGISGQVRTAPPHTYLGAGYREHVEISISPYAASGNNLISQK